MPEPKHNEENIDRLAAEVTDRMEMDVILEQFENDQYRHYKANKEAFLTDWKDMEMEEKE